MKPLFLGAAVCLFSSLLAAQNTTTFHSTAEGAFALVNINNMAAEIEVDRGNTQTFLMVIATTPDPNGGFTVTSSFGMIPNDDFVTNGSSLQRMALNVDTSQVPGFQSTTCTISFTPSFTETCGQGPLGLIQINWIGNGITAFKRVEERQTTQGGLKVDLHINADQISANASGSYLGSSFPAAAVASTDNNHDTTITITQ
jgi:hypothetical protein